MEKETANGWNVWGFIGVIFSLGLLWVVFIYYFDWKPELVNSFFSAMAFGAIIYSIYQQSLELKLTRDEFIAQNETFSKQRFENTFFKMIELAQLNLSYINNNQSLIALAHMADPEESKGKNGIYEMISSFSSHTNTKQKDFTPSALWQILEHSLKLYNANNYLMSLSNLYKLINESPLIQEKERQFYASIVNSNLSNAEKHLLYLSTMSQEYKALRLILNKYGVKPDFHMNQFVLNNAVVNALSIEI